MTEMKVYRALADAFVSEGVDTIFVLTGDGNMHWEAAFAQHNGTKSYHVRHEHSAVAMATAYAVKKGKVGVASVTCGPGLTQIMTALTTACQASVPLVVFAGESPMHAAWYNQHVNQAPLVVATGAHYISCHSVSRVLDCVRDAFFIAQHDRRPVVLGVPLDMQQELLTPLGEYSPSRHFIPDTGPLLPHPSYVATALQRILSAQRIVVLGGRGVVQDDAREECEILAERCGALLAATLPVRGLFDHSPYSLGVSGGFAHEASREYFAQADLLIAVGTSLSNYTGDGGRLFPNADILQIDISPQGLRSGRMIADIFLRGNAKFALQALIDGLPKQERRTDLTWRSDKLSEFLAGPADSTQFSDLGGYLDPRTVVSALDGIIPKDWEIVTASGHSSYFSAQLRGRSARRSFAIREFGAIGNGLCYAAGVAAANVEQPVVLIDGDGGFLMHIQELETIRRHKLKILCCVLNDGAFGSEIHKLRSDGLDDHGGIFGRGDLGAIARGFGLEGNVISNLSMISPLLQSFTASNTSEVWDFHISDLVTSPVMRRNLASRR